ncbi:MAG: histidine kinase [Pedobacter sp.]|nr:MAG: histidine kinase [Pedobacter sp.]
MTKKENYRTIVKELKSDYPKLSEFELLSLAIQIERNQILENGLVVSSDDSNPTGLEAIAISLGYTDKQLSTTITDVLLDMANKR